MKYVFLKIFICIFVFFFSEAAFAADDIDKAKDVIVSTDQNNYTNEFKRSLPQRIRRYIYEKPTLENFAYTQWGLGITDIDDNETIDSFIRITECKIFNSFKSNDFEWGKIRQATRDFIVQNKEDFPVLYELRLPLKLGNYDEQNSYFELSDQSKVKSVRIFEIAAAETDINISVCNSKSKSFGSIVLGFFIEISRPFSLLRVPAENSVAKVYIEEKSKLYQSHLDKMDDAVYSEKDMSEYKTAYLSIYFRLFTYKNREKNSSGTSNISEYAKILGTIDGYEVYADVDKKTLFYSRNYLSNKEEKKSPEVLNSEIEMLKKKIFEVGLLGERL